jgi:hypothetical protein
MAEKEEASKTFKQKNRIFKILRFSRLIGTAATTNFREDPFSATG